MIGYNGDLVGSWLDEDVIRISKIFSKYDGSRNSKRIITYAITPIDNSMVRSCKYKVHVRRKTNIIVVRIVFVWDKYIVYSMSKLHVLDFLFPLSLLRNFNALFLNLQFFHNSFFGFQLVKLHFLFSIG